MQKFDKYLNRENSPIPDEHLIILKSGTEIPLHWVLNKEDINRLFENGYLEGENGFRRLSDGSTYVSVLTKMPEVSIEMIDWWFWWHAKEAIRYQVWYPEMHFDIDADFQGRYEDESISLRERLYLSTHLVTEDIGIGREEILIDFKSPEVFGFDAHLLSNEVTIISGRVGSKKWGIWGTDMCHFVRKTKNGGVEMRSRFWIGNRIERMRGIGKPFMNSILNQSFLKRKLIPKGIGQAMFYHCSQEYHNLAAILPELYREEHLSLL